MQLFILQFFFYSLIWQFCFLSYSTGTDSLNEMLEMTQAESNNSSLIQTSNRERMEKDRMVRNSVIETFKWELTKLTEEENILYDYMEAYSAEVSKTCKLVQQECLIITDKDQQECKYVTQRCFFQNVRHCFQNEALINTLNEASVTVQIKDKSFVFKRKSAEDTPEKKMEKDKAVRNMVVETFKWELTKLTEEEKPFYDDLSACSTEVNKICNLVQGECSAMKREQQECRYVTQRCFFQNVSHCLQNKNLIELS